MQIPATLRSTIYGPSLPYVRPPLVWPGQRESPLWILAPLTAWKADHAEAELLTTILGPKALNLPASLWQPVKVHGPFRRVHLAALQGGVGVLFGPELFDETTPVLDLGGGRQLWIVPSLAEMLQREDAKKIAWRQLQKLKSQYLAQQTQG